MKNKINFLIIGAITLLTCCGRFSNKDEKQNQQERIVCVSKQYNEIIFELGAQQNLVAVDESSIYPPQIKSLPNVGYHRALSAEGILSMKPTLFLHDGNVGPEAVMQQLQKLKIPIKKFPHDGNTIDSTKMLIKDIAAFFHKEKQGDSLCALMDAGIKMAMDSAKRYTDTPKVMIIQYGRASNSYLVISGKGISGKLVKWAGGKIPFEGGRNMAPLSAEVIAQADPDVILLTDYGYDRLGSNEKVKELPGVAATKASRNNRIYRVEEHDIIYLGPRTGQNILMLEKLIHAGKPAS